MPSSSEPIPIQVVFQGGGARLCLLMAVCDVLKRYQGNQIQITRVAGSSAGAIAATMLASNKSPEAYKSDIQSLGQEYVRMMQTVRWRGALRVFKGDAFFHRMNLEEFFDKLFCAHRGPKKLSDLPLAAELYFTDLYSLEARVAPSDESIPKALAKSCRFPFALVGYGSGNTDVDGGLAFNLPVDRLKLSESVNGTVIGISFNSRFRSTGNYNLISYAQQLFSAAIQNGVIRSEAILGKRNIFSIDTEIGTFDFARALNDGFGVHYQLVADQFTTWLNEWLELSRPDGNPAHVGSAILVHPTLSNAPLPSAIIRDIEDRLRSDPATNAKSVIICELALLDDKANFLGKYRTRTIMKFMVTRPAHVVQFDFEIGVNGSFTSANLGCSAIDSKGQSIRFIPNVQEITQQGDKLRKFRLYYLFDRPLLPNSEDEPYILEFQYEADDPYPNLGIGSEASTHIGRLGTAEEMILAVGFPRAKFKMGTRIIDVATKTRQQLQEIGYHMDGEELITSESLPLSEFLDAMRLDRPPEEFFLIGRRARNVEQGQGFGFVVE